MCCDVSVLRSADCWTDPKLLRGQLKQKVPVKVPRAISRRRFAVLALQEEETQQRFCKAIGDTIDEERCEEAGGKEKCELIRDSIVKSAESTVGSERSKQPDWFKEKFQEAH